MHPTRPICPEPRGRPRRALVDRRAHLARMSALANSHDLAASCEAFTRELLAAAHLG
jgi:hypothetical protein